MKAIRKHLAHVDEAESRGVDAVREVYFIIIICSSIFLYVFCDLVLIARASTYINYEAIPLFNFQLQFD